MARPFFSFKQFTVYHDRCAMKVGTDGVLLGAWTDIAGARRILDIGTGTGLIALMLAQRSCQATVKGIDIDEDSVGQAAENVAASPWKERVSIELEDVREFCKREAGNYDCIVSNPPYFRENVHCPAQARNTARHTSGLSFDELLSAVELLLSFDGRLSVIVPADAASDFISCAVSHSLYLQRQTWVHTKPGLDPKRVLMTFSRQMGENSVDHLTIEMERHVYTPEFIRLTRDFYLAL